MNIVWCCRSMPQSWHRGRWRMSGGCWTGSEMNRRGQGKEGERRRKRKEERPYHDITPLLCHYISEWHSFSLTSGVAQGSWSGGGRGAQSVRMLKVEFLSHCWGVDFSIGDHMLSELDQPRNLTRFRWGKLWYLVKFLGWSSSDNMWSPISQPLLGCGLQYRGPHVIRA